MPNSGSVWRVVSGLILEGGMLLEGNWMVLLQQQNQLGKVVEINQTAERYGLVLSEEDAKLILKEKNNALREQKRVEFGGGITPKIIYEFCDSDFIDQNNYVETIIRLHPFEIPLAYPAILLSAVTPSKVPSAFQSTSRNPNAAPRQTSHNPGALLSLGSLGTRHG